MTCRGLAWWWLAGYVIAAKSSRGGLQELVPSSRFWAVLNPSAAVRSETVSSSVNNVSCRPAAVSRRLFEDLHGVSTGPATSEAPFETSRSVAEAVSSTWNASRMCGETRRPTSISSIMSTCAGFASSSVARPAFKMTTRASPSPSNAASSEGCIRRTAVRRSDCRRPVSTRLGTVAAVPSSQRSLRCLTFMRRTRSNNSTGSPPSQRSRRSSGRRRPRQKRRVSS